MKFDKSCLRAQRSSSQSASSDRWILKKGGGSCRSDNSCREAPIQSTHSAGRIASSQRIISGTGRAGQGRPLMLFWQMPDPKGEVDFADDFDWSRLLRPCNG